MLWCPTVPLSKSATSLNLLRALLLLLTLLHGGSADLLVPPPELAGQQAALLLLLLLPQPGVGGVPGQTEAGLQADWQRGEERAGRTFKIFSSEV